MTTTIRFFVKTDIADLEKFIYTLAKKWKNAII